MAKESRKLVTLECVECKNRNYHTDKRVKGQNVIKRIELEKFCNSESCRKRTMHKETK